MLRCRRLLALSSFVLSLALSAEAAAQTYQRVTDSDEVVLGKLFPKKSKVELDAKLGIVLNSSYTQTFLANAGLTYFWSEEWGFNVEGNFASVQDKNERKCIETFYNDPNFNVSNECGEEAPVEEGPEASEDANWGPAYVPIRQLKYMFTGNFVWNPIYGKQIVLLSATNYFDFYVLMGGGVAMSDFYRKQPETDDGAPARGTFCVKKDQDAGECDPANLPGGQNPGTDDPEQVGNAGRPEPEAQTNVLAHLAIGQRFHFFKRFMVMASLENYTLLGTEAGFDNFLTIMGGFGVRF